MEIPVYFERRNQRGKQENTLESRLWEKAGEETVVGETTGTATGRQLEIKGEIRKISKEFRQTQSKAECWSQAVMLAPPERPKQATDC